MEWYPKHYYELSSAVFTDESTTPSCKVILKTARQRKTDQK
jgi:hypothetical protein